MKKSSRRVYCYIFHTVQRLEAYLTCLQQAHVPVHSFEMLQYTWWAGTARPATFLSAGSFDSLRGQAFLGAQEEFFLDSSALEYEDTTFLRMSGTTRPATVQRHSREGAGRHHSVFGFMVAVI
jgi:hypothetical protein